MTLTREFLTRIENRFNDLTLAMKTDGTFTEVAKYKGLLKEYGVELKIVASHMDIENSLTHKVLNLANGLVCLGKANYYQLNMSHLSTKKVLKELIDLM